MRGCQIGLHVANLVSQKIGRGDWFLATSWMPCCRFGTMGGETNFGYFRMLLAAFRGNNLATRRPGVSSAINKGAGCGVICLLLTFSHTHSMLLSLVYTMFQKSLLFGDNWLTGWNVCRSAAFVLHCCCWFLEWWRRVTSHSATTSWGLQWASVHLFTIVKWTEFSTKLGVFFIVFVTLHVLCRRYNVAHYFGCSYSVKHSLTATKIIG